MAQIHIIDVCNVFITSIYDLNLKPRCILILATIAIGGYFLFKRFFNNIVDGISFKGARIKFDTPTNSSISFDVFISYQNNNRLAIPISGFVGSIFYGERSISNLQLANPVELKPYSITELQMRSSINYLSLGFDIINLIISKSFRERLSVRGVLSINNLNTSIDHTLINS